MQRVTLKSGSEVYLRNRRAASTSGDLHAVRAEVEATICDLNDWLLAHNKLLERQREFDSTVSVRAMDVFVRRRLEKLAKKHGWGKFDDDALADIRRLFTPTQP